MSQWQKLYISDFFRKSSKNAYSPLYNNSSWQSYSLMYTPVAFFLLVLECPRELFDATIAETSQFIWYPGALCKVATTYTGAHSAGARVATRRKTSSTAILHTGGKRLPVLISDEHRMRTGLRSFFKALWLTSSQISAFLRGKKISNDRNLVIIQVLEIESLYFDIKFILSSFVKFLQCMKSHNYCALPKMYTIYYDCKIVLQIIRNIINLR